MSRHAPRPFERLIALFPPVAAGIALAGAGVALAVALGLFRLPVLSVPFPAPAGGFVFAVGPARAGILAAALTASAACLMIARPTLPGAALVLSGAAAIVAVNIYTLVFAALIVLVLARHARSAGATALAVLPAVLVVAAEATGLRAAMVIAGAAGLVAGGVAAAVTLDLVRLAQAVAVSFAAIALVATGVGDAGAARLAIETGALAAPVLALAAGVIEEATGTRSPDWLGGLARGMPRFSLVFFGALAFASLLPPGPGFAAFRAAFDSARGAGGWSGGLGAIALGFGFALNGFAALRVFGLVCLGRPRSLRAAAAEDAPARILLALVLPVACGFALALRAEPFAVLVPLAILAALYRFTVRTGPVDAPPFEDGFARPPAWLPFGDPATQINATGFAAPLSALVAKLPRPRFRLSL